MPALLQIDSSPRAASVSSRLAAAFVEIWKRQNPTGTVFHHNTSLERFPYLDENAIDAFFTPAAERTAAQKLALAFSDQLVDELLAADVVVLGAPMWNLSIPASLKAWIDLIVREGRTFAFTAQGVAPLVPPGKRVYVFSARGGAYPASTSAAMSARMASGASFGAKRFVTRPFRSTKNFVKFHLIACVPSRPGASFFKCA